jgi:hypothetical protein
MEHIPFNPSRRLIVLPLKIAGINGDDFRESACGFRYGSLSDTSIPTKVASDLGYDLSNPKHVVRLTTGSGTIPAKIVTVRKLTAIGETVQNIVIILQPLLKM